jgi:hypothetical protein
MLLLWGWLLYISRPDMVFLAIFFPLNWLSWVIFFSLYRDARYFAAIRQMSRPIRDSRNPVIFLRIFTSAKRTPQSLLRELPLMPFVFPWFLALRVIGSTLSTPLERRIAPSINAQIGPLVAAGDARDFLPSIGARKLYFADETWTAELTEWFKSAAAVIVSTDVSLSLFHIGLSGAPSGIDWELKTLARHFQPTCIFLISAPESFEQPRWASVVQVFGSAGWRLREAEPLHGCVITFDPSGRAVLLASGLSKGRTYADVIRRALMSVDNSRWSDGFILPGTEPVREDNQPAVVPMPAAQRIAPRRQQYDWIKRARKTPFKSGAAGFFLGGTRWFGSMFVGLILATVTGLNQRTQNLGETSFYMMIGVLCGVAAFRVSAPLCYRLHCQCQQYVVAKVATVMGALCLWAGAAGLFYIWFAYLWANWLKN